MQNLFWSTLGARKISSKYLLNHWCFHPWSVFVTKQAIYSFHACENVHASTLEDKTANSTFPAKGFKFLSKQSRIFLPLYFFRYCNEICSPMTIIFISPLKLFFDVGEGPKHYLRRCRANFVIWTVLLECQFKDIRGGKARRFGKKQNID